MSALPTDDLEDFDLDVQEFKKPANVKAAKAYLERVKKTWRHGPWQVADEAIRLLNGGEPHEPCPECGAEHYQRHETGCNQVS